MRKEKRGSTYYERHQALLRLGFANYKAYLASDTWKEIRTRVLTENPTCAGCGRKATQVHHERYTIEALSGQDLTPLHAVCGSCHYKAEFRIDGKKLTPIQATMKIRQFRAWNKIPMTASEMERLERLEAERVARSAKRKAKKERRKKRRAGEHLHAADNQAALQSLRSRRDAFRPRVSAEHIEYVRKYGR